jgi:ABC-type uncharacterized transport system substrate-binding protein
MQFGVDYIQSGIQSADLLNQIINKNIKPMDTEIIAPNSKIYINSFELKRLNITLPESLKQEVTLL